MIQERVKRQLVPWESNSRQTVHGKLPFRGPRVGPGYWLASQETRRYNYRNNSGRLSGLLSRIEERSFLPCPR